MTIGETMNGEVRLSLATKVGEPVNFGDLCSHDIAAWCEHIYLNVVVR